MYLLILQLSDIHLNVESDVLLSRVDAIRGAVQAEMVGVDGIFVAVTGDVVNRGRAEAYEAAHVFFDALGQALKESKPGGVEVHWAFVPGNHDCTLTLADQARDILIPSLLQERPERLLELDASVLGPVMKVQDPFFGFAARRSSASGYPVSRDRLCLDSKVEVGGRKVFVRTVNTSWMSRQKEQRGTLLALLRPLPPEAADADLRIAMLHHPYSWLETRNATSVRKRLEEEFDLILTGHEHVAESYNKRSIRNVANEYFEASALQGDTDDESGFTVVVVDVEKSRFATVMYEWQHVRYVRTDDSGWNPLERRALSGPASFDPAPAFAERLQDPGARFTHSRKDRVTMDDVFVYPDLRDVSQTRTQGDGASSAYVDGRDIVDRAVRHRKVLLIGGELTGKTTLLRRLHADLRQEGVAPVVLDGGTLASVEPERLARAVRRAVVEQYGFQAEEHYMQREPSKRALLVDDLDKSPLIRSALLSALGTLEGMFWIVVITVGDTFTLEEFLKEQEKGKSLLAYRQYSIREFGHLLRSRLVKRWETMGRAEEIESEDSGHRCRAMEALLTTLVGKGIVPSKPIFLLTFLQAQEAEQTLSTETGSFGYHYEFLIAHALHTALAEDSRLKTSLRVDMAMTVLCELAQARLGTPDEGFSETDLEDSIADYRRRYKLEFPLESMKRLLMSAGMLRRTPDGSYRFAYPYIYYFFAAKSIQVRLSDARLEGATRTVVEELIESLHVEEKANIVVFLVYLTKDSQVIDSLLGRAARVFEDVDPCDLDEDVDHVGRGGFVLPAPVIEGAPSSNRERYLRRRDEDEDLDKDQPPADEGDFFGDLNVALKYLQILGQVLRSFPGSLDGDTKVRLAEEASAIGLRSMNSLVRVFRMADPILRSMSRTTTRAKGCPIRRIASSASRTPSRISPPLGATRSCPGSRKRSAPTSWGRCTRS